MSFHTSEADGSLASVARYSGEPVGSMVAIPRELAVAWQCTAEVESGS